MPDAPVRIDPTAAPTPPPASPTGTPVLPPSWAKWLVPIVVIAGFVAGAPAMGFPVPPMVAAVAGLVVSLGAALGVASPGVRK